MFSKLFITALAVSYLLVHSAGRLEDGVQRRSYYSNVKPRRSEQSSENLKTRTESFRFLTNATQKYKVDSLPDFPFDLGEMYSGLIPIDMKNASRALFYIFQPKLGAPVDEITIWLQGGPGCSSLEGFLQENGRFTWTWGQYTPTINPYSWVNLTNVLWVEYPVGVGFSIGDVTASSQEEIANDFADFFLNFQEIFGISKFKIFITGESYAGRYVPYISAEFLDRKFKDADHYNVTGSLLYAPVIGSFIYSQQQATIVPFLKKNNNILGYNDSFLCELEKLDKTCGFEKYRQDYYKFPPKSVQTAKSFNSTSEADCDIWHMAYKAAYAPNPCFNPYLITQGQCPLLSDPMGLPSDLAFSYSDLQIYFNRTDVKEAIHAPTDSSWFECTGPVFAGTGGAGNVGDLSVDPLQSVLPRVIEATNRVLIATGDLDFEITVTGTLLSIQNMTWGGKLGFQKEPSNKVIITLPDLLYQDLFQEQGFGDIDNPQGTMGIQHYERGLMWTETSLCGHMVPQFQPRSSYRHLQWVLGHIETL